MVAGRSARQEAAECRSIRLRLGRRRQAPEWVLERIGPRRVGRAAALLLHLLELFLDLFALLSQLVELILNRLALRAGRKRERLLGCGIAGREIASQVFELGQCPVGVRARLIL